MKKAILLLTMICLAAIPTPAQKQRNRIIPCQLVQVMSVSPEAQLAINDPVLFIVECKGDRKLYIPGHQWPQSLSTDIGTRVKLVTDKNGTAIGLKVGKQVVRVQTSIPRHLL